MPRNPVECVEVLPFGVLDEEADASVEVASRLQACDVVLNDWES